MQAALDAEREAHSGEIDALEQAIARARDDAERARLAAERTELEASLEAAARRKAQQEAIQAAHRAAQAEREARRAEADARDAQAKLKEALGRVAEVRETARGLIVSLPDVLFEFDRADLRPGTREILAKMAGILQVVDSYFLSVEGHTDSIGADLYNRELSRRRAENVRDYLIEQGISPAMIQARGFGENTPVASNDTAEGRQKNRRVEVVVMEQQTYEVHMD